MTVEVFRQPFYLDHAFRPLRAAGQRFPTPTLRVSTTGTPYAFNEG
jgi:hypothetical protein